MAITALSCNGTPGRFRGGPPVTVALTGVSATGAVGTLVAAFALGLSGVSGTGSIGSLSPSSGGITLTGVSCTGAVGTLTASATSLRPVVIDVSSESRTERVVPAVPIDVPESRVMNVENDYKTAVRRG